MALKMLAIVCATIAFAPQGGLAAPRQLFGGGCKDSRTTKCGMTANMPTGCENDACCTATSPCPENAGDCDHDSDCQGTLQCSTESCRVKGNKVDCNFLGGNCDDCCQTPKCNNRDGNENCRECTRASGCAWCESTNTCLQTSGDRDGKCPGAKKSVCSACDTPGLCTYKPNSACVASSTYTHQCICNPPYQQAQFSDSCYNPGDANHACKDKPGKVIGIPKQTCVEFAKTPKNCEDRQSASSIAVNCPRSCKIANCVHQN